ncbi:UDP-N-acetylglucosamine 1-carboxyvinyltransferase [candidate division WOR-3 bacterium]|nr:UDP-N-acetylglucosamine 1-carboxyvinyltransferase [candidate division WOR-3 bacterium]
MYRFLVSGGQPLRGAVQTASAKNAVLPILAACLLTEETCTITNLPALEDVNMMLQLLRSMGVAVERQGRAARITAAGRVSTEAPYDIVRKMRASYYVLGPLVARFGRAKVSLPGGCAIGARPVDLHLRGMSGLGAKVTIEHGYIDARAKKLAGAALMLEGAKGPSVGATANTMMAAVLAGGETVISGAACEPEIVDLADFLNCLGAKVSGAGTPEVRIKGVRRLSGAEYRPIPDRIEAGTFAAAACITCGDVEIRLCRPDHLTAVIDVLRRAGARVETTRSSMRVCCKGRAKACDITTAPYPGFPTDLQAQFTALLSTAAGTSVVTENIFEGRFLHAMELARMGARIDVKGSTAVVHGVERLSSAQVMASDLRASAALVLAGLAAEGTTEVLRVYHLDRGYEKLERKLSKLGAKVERVADST